MVSSIVAVGGEDLSYQVIGGNYSVGASGPISLDTTAGRFRAGYARYGINISVNGLPNSLFIRENFAALSTFWFSARIWASLPAGSTANNYTWILRDANLFPRLRLHNQGSNPSTGPFIIETITAAGVATQIGASIAPLFSIAPSTPDKLDVYVNYGTSGQLLMYLNGTLVYTFSGDITTNGNLTLAALDFGQCGESNTAGQCFNVWSETCVSLRDTRNFSIATQVANAVGNTDTFTSGTAANINGTQFNDASPNYSQISGQVQQYTVTPNLPTGNFSVISLVQQGRVTTGSTGPQNIDFGVRTGSTDYFSSDMLASTGYSLLTTNWDTNPNTAVPWQPSDLNSAGFNFGFRSET
jgi:hypothetical protein